MADIRFNISGSSAPFLAQLYCCGSAIYQMVIDYSGKTTYSVCGNSFPINVFGNVNPSSSYTLKITDNVGHTISTIVQSCSNIAPLVLPVKNLTLTGQPTAPPMTTYYCVATGVVSISPALSAGQCVGVCLTACTRGGGTCGVNSNVTISCYQYGSPPGAWMVKNTYTNLNTISGTNIPLCFGDALCYSMSTSCCTGCAGNLCGCAKLAIKSVTGCSTVNAQPSGQQSVGFGISRVATTTTTSTTLQPIEVYLTDGVFNACSPTSVRACAKIVTYPPLTANQCFRLCFRDCARSNNSDIENGTLRACSYATCVNTTKCNLASSSLANFTLGNDIDVCENYITVTAANINSIVFCATALSNANNASLVNVNCSSVCFYALACQCCGIYVLGPQYNQYMSVHTANVSTPEGGHVPLNTA